MRSTRHDFLTETAYSRFQTLGHSGSSLVDLLALGIAESESDLERAQDIAMRLLPDLRRLRGLADIEQKVIEERGVDAFAAARCLALIELGRRLTQALKGPGTQISGADDVAQLLGYLRDEKKEHFVAIMLDTQNVVMRTRTIHIGTLTSSIVGPRELFREAIRDGACSIIVAHNHPSGEPTPSKDDIDLTRKLHEIGKMLDIPVLDHVIIGENRHTSLRDQGIIK